MKRENIKLPRNDSASEAAGRPSNIYVGPSTNISDEPRLVFLPVCYLPLFDLLVLSKRIALENGLLVLSRIALEEPARLIEEIIHFLTNVVSSNGNPI